MKRLFIIAVVFLFWFFPNQLLAQTYPVKTYINTWLIDDETQTEKAATLFDDLSEHKDSVLFHKLIKELEPIIKTKSKARLTARFVMYKALWYLETDPKNISISMPSTIQAIKLVYPLDDRQLNAELYGLYGELSLRKGDIETSLLYNLKSLEIQEQVGAAYFPKIAWMYSSLARSLYRTQDYTQAISNGLKCLQQIKQYEKVSNYDKIFLYDIIGSAYYKTRQLDQATLYYQKIVQLINTQQGTSIDSDWAVFWLGLVDGYLGRIAFDRQQYAQATSLFAHAIKASISYNEIGNAAGFTNNLAKVETLQGKYGQAIAHYQKAYLWSRKVNDDQAAMDASLGLAALYRKTKHVDSSYHYYDKYHQLNDKIQALINRSKLNAAKARLDYDNMQDNLGQSEKKIRQERLLRNSILMGIVLLTVIAILFYNRFRLRKEYQQRALETEMMEAKEKLDEFKKSTKEKDAIIQQLTTSINTGRNQQQFDINEHIILTEEDWMSFKKAFSKAYPKFLPKLKIQLDHITPAEERLSALLYLQLTSNQIANTLGISKESVDRSKRRLKQRLGINSNQSIDEYLHNLS